MSLQEQIEKLKEKQEKIKELGIPVPWDIQHEITRLENQIEEEKYRAMDFEEFVEKMRLSNLTKSSQLLAFAMLKSGVPYSEVNSAWHNNKDGKYGYFYLSDESLTRDPERYLTIVFSEEDILRYCNKNVYVLDDPDGPQEYFVKATAYVLEKR